MKSFGIIVLFIFQGFISLAQLQWEGQLSGFGNFSPQNDFPIFLGGRYITGLNYTHSLDSGQSLDFLASANLSGSVFNNTGPRSEFNANFSPYRFWARYSGKQFQIRIGLQKIDFGSATMLRPLQWFNQIDPRDPLALTNGVYGILGRYYFKNNANIWLWGLYGNSRRRGFDAVATNPNQPEFGSRLQLPIPKGEIGFTYHHRNADASELLMQNGFENIPEDRFAIDSKLDLAVGLWFEATYIRKHENLGVLTHQNLINIGTDYTFGIGNGITVIAEHLISNAEQNAFEFTNTAQVSAINLSYPIGFFDNLNSLIYYSWATESTTFFLNYQHQFKKVLAYLMLYYNPAIIQGIQENELINNFSGPGIRLLFVFNH